MFGCRPRCPTPIYVEGLPDATWFGGLWRSTRAGAHRWRGRRVRHRHHSDQLGHHRRMGVGRASCPRSRSSPPRSTPRISSPRSDRPRADGCRSRCRPLENGSGSGWSRQIPGRACALAPDTRCVRRAERSWRRAKVRSAARFGDGDARPDPSARGNSQASRAHAHRRGHIRQIALACSSSVLVQRSDCGCIHRSAGPVHAQCIHGVSPLSGGSNCRGEDECRSQTVALQQFDGGTSEAGSIAERAVGISRHGHDRR